MNTIRLEPVACSLCASDDSVIELEGYDREHDIVGTFSIHQCKGCGHRYLNPRPVEADIALLYPDDYSPFRASSELSCKPKPVRWITNLLHFGPWVVRQRGIRLLELGCGRGDSLFQFACDGWTTTGIEPNDESAARARAAGLNVLTGDDTLIDTMEPGSFDMVHAFMVIEHTTEPVETLRRLRRVISENGTLRISVPNFSHRTRHRYGIDWFPLQLPRHLHHFTPSTITDALKQSGWTVERIWHQPTNSDRWKSSDLQRERTGGSARINSAILRRSLDLATLIPRVVVTQFRGSSRLTICARPSDAR